MKRRKVVGCCSVAVLSSSLLPAGTADAQQTCNPVASTSPGGPPVLLVPPPSGPNVYNVYLAANCSGYPFQITWSGAPTQSPNSSSTLGRAATNPSTFTVTANYYSGYGTTSASGSTSVQVNTTLLPATLPPAVPTVFYSQAISVAQGGTLPWTFSITGGSLPNGLSLSPSGVLSGTPSGPGGTFNFVVTAVDASGFVVNQNYSITVAAPLAIATNTLAAPRIGVPYDQTIAVINGVGPFTFSIPNTAGSLPPGLTLNPSSGAITGTPTTIGSYTFTVLVRDARGATDTHQYTLNVGSALAIATTSLPGGAIGVPYSAAVRTNNSVGQVTFAVQGGGLPTGLTLNPQTGVISGTPTTPGVGRFTIVATDTGGGTASRTYTVTIAGITISPTTLPDASLGSPYQQTISATNGTPPITFSVLSGALPPGLTLNPQTGVISGTPTSVGSFSFQIGATDANGILAGQQYTMNVVQGLVISPVALPPGTVNVPYSQPLSVSGGTGPFTFRVTSGALPQGLTLNPQTGVISGTPTSAGPSNFTVTVTDNSNRSASQTYSLTISSPAALTISPPSLPAFTPGQQYTQTLTVANAVGPVTFTISNGALPTGLTLNPATGVISGTPTGTGTTFTVSVRDANGTTASQTYTLNPNAAPNPLVISPATLPDVIPGVPYSQTFTITNGTAPFTFAVTSGALPTGLTLNAQTGVLSGTPTTGGTFTITVTDAKGNTVSQSYTVRVASAPQVSIPTVQQLIAPQTQIALNTAVVQLNNIRQRLDQLRMQHSPTVTQALRVGVDGQTLPPLSAFALAPLDKDGKPVPQRGGGASADSSDAFERWGAFVNGDVDIGRRSTIGNVSGFKLHTKGVTAGVDYRFRGNHVLGASVGYIKADADMDANLGSQDAHGYSFSVFGSYVPVENAYIDAIANFGHNSYDLHRQQLAQTFDSSTSGHQVGLALNAGYQINRGALAFTPFARLEYVDAKVKGFSENGDPSLAIEVTEQKVKATTLSVGAQVSYAISTSWGVFMPNGRLEFQRVTHSSFRDVNARFVGAVTSPGVLIPVLGDDKNFGNFALGGTLVLPRNVSAFFNYERLFGKSATSDNRYTLGVRIEF